MAHTTTEERLHNVAIAVIVALENRVFKGKYPSSFLETYEAAIEPVLALILEDEKKIDREEAREEIYDFVERYNESRGHYPDMITLHIFVANLLSPSQEDIKKQDNNN